VKHGSILDLFAVVICAGKMRTGRKMDVQDGPRLKERLEAAHIALMQTGSVTRKAPLGAREAPKQTPDEPTQ
jgi:hypothetical protein